MAPPKTNLSKHVLQMKFMKRTKESEDLKRFEDEGRAFFQDAATTLDPDGKGANIIVQHNWYLTENLMLGRYSFNGMNPKIEEIMKSYCDFGSDDHKDNIDEGMDVDVSAQRFARNVKRNKTKKKNVQDYLEEQNEIRNADSSLVQTMASKFVKGKRKKCDESVDNEEESRKKMKFLKPEPE
uniref:M-phase phosphoprotein 6 n=1 Tax=Cacopsylla melanoneura TaxID=428564 RepID=A0A8D8VD32_9HEMI